MGGRPVHVTDPLGGVTLLRWSQDGGLAERTGPDGAKEAVRPSIPRSPKRGVVWAMEAS